LQFGLCVTRIINFQTYYQPTERAAHWAALSVGY
jgi:hypothetical protein